MPSPWRRGREGVRLLLVEDDSMIGAAAQQGLRHEGHTVDWVRDGQEAEAVAKAGAYDLVLLDLGLPRKDGLSILRGWRARNNTVPVLIITARDAVADRVAGLDAGADDYLVKPFDLDELSARVRAASRQRVSSFQRSACTSRKITAPAAVVPATMAAPANVHVSQTRLGVASSTPPARASVASAPVMGRVGSSVGVGCRCTDSRTSPPPTIEIGRRRG